MIQAFRASVLLLAVAFAYLFASSAEGLILGVLRAWAGLDEANLIPFHLARLAANLAPLLLAGWACDLVVSGEPGWQAALRRVFLGILFGIVVFQLYLMFWMMASIGSEAAEGMAFSPVWETVYSEWIPFIILSVISALFCAFSGQPILFQGLEALIAVLGAISWLWATGKLEFLISTRSVALVFPACFLAAFGTVFLAQKARLSL